MIPYALPDFDDLRLPQVVRGLTALPQGLVLVTGATGSGKSTTLAAMIDAINSSRPCHILTIEDPIEYVHRHKVAAVNQREVGEDTESFARGLRSALREDPDVLLIGEMRDLETIQTALTIAETGHLVFATLHTNDSAQADRPRRRRLPRRRAGPDPGPAVQRAAGRRLPAAAAPGRRRPGRRVRGDAGLQRRSAT